MLTRIVYTGDGTRKIFEIPFPYISTTHVKVRVNLVPLNVMWDYYFLPDGRLEFRNAPLTGARVEVYRETEIEQALVQYQDGAVLTERELNLAVLQNLYLTQEITELWTSLVDGRLAALIPGGAETDDVIDAVVQEVLNSTLLADLQQRINDIDTNASNILAAYIDINDLRDRVEELTAIDLDGLDTLILNEQTERIAGDTALASTLDLIGARNGPGTAFVLNLNTVKVTSTESIGDRLDAITARFGTNEALIATETNARVAADSAFAGQLATFQVRMTNAEAAITTETAARVTADTAIAQQITTLTTNLNGNTASIQTLQTVTNGLAAQYMVKTDVNGYVSGFGLYNSGGSSSFTILADKFSLVTPGQSPQVPFAVDASGVYMQNAYIRNLNVDKITGGNIGSQWNITNAAGKIVLDTGSFMKVIGVGFGANSDLLEWFGPKQAINLCTKANGKTWVGTNGDAYFGGTLSAGTLFNARTTTDTASNAQVTLGPYGTNGNTKTIVLSYAGQSDFTLAGHVAADYEGDPVSTSVQVYRSLAGGAETLVNTYVFTGTTTAEQDFIPPAEGGPGAITIVNQSASGSYTFTDNISGTQSRTYRAVISSRTGFYTALQVQAITITSTEQ